MIHFPVLRTRRLTVQLRELSIDESIAIAAMPVHLEEAAYTAFLRYAVVMDDGKNTDPACWTVQERMLAVCHYLASVLEDGPDFSIGPGHYSDYLSDSPDISTPASSERLRSVILAMDSGGIRHLTGAMAESIERLLGEMPKYF